MRSFFTTSSWGLLLILAFSLSNCQKASYQFQNPASAYQAPSAVAAADTAVLLGSGSFSPQATTNARGLPLARRLRLALPKRVVRVASQRVAGLRLFQTSAAQTTHSATRYAPRQLPRQDPLPDARPHRRSRGVAFLLAFLLGSTGAHLFYLGYYGRGLLYLLLTLASIVLLSIVAALFVAFIFGGGGGLLGVAIIALVLASAVGVLSLIDAIFILTGDLKPKNGEYYPRFFQTNPEPPKLRTD